MKKVKKELLSMGIFLIFGVMLNFYFIPTQVQVATWGTGGAYTAQTFPHLIARGMILLSITGIIHAIYLGRKEIWEKEKSEPCRNWREIIYPVIVSAVIILYYILFREFGFLISTGVFVTLMVLILKEKKRYIVFSLLFEILIYVLFIQVLHINLP